MDKRSIVMSVPARLARLGMTLKDKQMYDSLPT